MATLRELRVRAKELGIDYSKEDTKEALEEMIAAKECEMGDSPLTVSDEPAPAEAVVETPADPPATAPVEDEPVAAEPPVSRTPAPKTSEADTEDDIPETSFRADLAIREGDLQTEFLEQAGKYAIYARKAAVANSRMLTAKMRVEVVEAELDKKIREKAASTGAKVTEKSIASEMVLDSAMQAAKRQYIAACEVYEIAKAAAAAFVQRRDMLMQLGAFARQEKDQIGTELHAKAKEVLKAA